MSGGHAHLFTNLSIEKMSSLCRSKIISEWRFGTDVLIHEFENGFIGGIDKLQSTLDETHFCSDIHSVVKKSELWSQKQIF